jgi:hypothetical protein
MPARMAEIIVNKSQNASSTDQYRVRGVGLLEFGRQNVSYKVGEKVIKYGFYVI